MRIAHPTKTMINVGGILVKKIVLSSVIFVSKNIEVLTSLASWSGVKTALDRGDCTVFYIG